MQATPTLDFIPSDSNQLNKFGQMLQKSWRNLTTLINNKIGFGDGVNKDNIDGIWVSVVTPGAPNTDFTVTHNLGRKAVGYLVMTKSAACDVYTGGVAGTLSQFTLRATAAGVTINVFFV